MRTIEAIKKILVLGAFVAVAAGCPGCPAQSGDADAGEEAPDSGEGTPDSGGGEPDGGDGCIPLTLGARDFQANLFGQLTGLRYAVSPGIDSAAPESLILELYDSTTPGLPPLQPGTFPLGVAPNDDLATCQHCVWMPVDWDGVSPYSKVFLATEGSITLTRVEDPLTEIFAGSASGVVLREATLDEGGALSFVQGGRCARLPAFTFDTSPTPDQPCVSAEDCGNPILEACSPATNSCGPPECGEFQGCPEERPVCLTQYGTISQGACYAVCDPAIPSTCGSGHTCVQLGVDPSFGVCLSTGSGALGETCAVEDTSTGCVPGTTCSAQEHACTNTCRYFDGDPGCQPDHACTVLGICDPVSSGAPVTFGQPCGDGAALAQGCAADAEAFRGICFAFRPEDPLVCEKACLGDQGCGPGEFCAPRFSSGLGICLPDPVCGDGILGEIDEVCDDGNTSSNDGCSGDCKTVEYGAICPNAPLLAGGDTPGDTTSAWDGFQASCQLGAARADVYRFEPPSRGRLRLTVDAATSHTLSLRAACADATSELACVTPEVSGSGELVQQITSTAELTVMVSAFTVIDQGPYTLRTEFVPESCGDGIVAGLEACDDGNTLSNDGCSADCSAIEYATYCAQAAPLSTSATGDNTGGPEIYTASCANNVHGSGPDRLFEYTAPASGTVQFTLVPGPGAGDLVLAVFDGCGSPAAMSELDCSSVYDTEQVEAPVTAGQTLTILVEGYNTFSTGAFTLSAEMLP